MADIVGTLNGKNTLSGTLGAVYGKDGKSAYELALKNGFEGSEAEWLESLHGVDGKDGQDGYTPVKGVDYFDGAKGDKGDTGNPGIYLGSGEMPEDCNVQIDPDGDVFTVDQFASAIKNTLRGEVLTASDVSPIEHNLKVNVESKNLIPYPFWDKTKTALGITFTDNGDGTVTATGTTTSSYYFTFVGSGNKLKLAKGKYFYSCIPIKGSIPTVYAYVTAYPIAGGQNLEFIDYGSGVSFELTEDCEITTTCVVAKEHDGTPVVFKPLLAKGTTATAWTPYVADLSGVEVSRCGKNIMSVNSVKFPLSAETTIWEGKITGNFVFSYELNLTNVTNDSSALFRWYFEDGTNAYGYAVNKGNLPSTIKGTITRITVVPWCDAKGGSVDNIQLELGTIKTDFEPYIEHTATTNADGTVNGLKSVSPNMTLLTDTSGAVINLEYNADTKMYIDNKFAELQALFLEG